jgi:hypothetical protein
MFWSRKGGDDESRVWKIPCLEQMFIGQISPSHRSRDISEQYFPQIRISPTSNVES